MRALDCTTATLASRSRSRSCCSRASRSRSHSIATEHAYPCRAHAPYVSACNHLRSIALAAQASSPTQLSQPHSLQCPKVLYIPDPAPASQWHPPTPIRSIHALAQSVILQPTHTLSLVRLMDCRRHDGRAMVAHSLICISPRSLTQQQQPPSLAPSLA